MKKQPSSTIMTGLCWGVFFLALVFLAFQVIPRALGQRDASKQAAAVPGNTLSHPTAISTAGQQARVIPSPLLPSDAQSVPSLPRTSQIPVSADGVGCTVTGSIDLSDPTQSDRLFRSSFPQTCPASTFCEIFGDPTPRHYDSYSFTNTTGASQCVTVDTNTPCTGTNFIFTGAYLGSFDPNNLCTNWIGDSGSSPNPQQAFSFDLADGQTVVVVVSEVTPNAGCSSYTVTVTPETICGGGTPTPTPTATPTPTPGPCQFRVLIVYSDVAGTPNELMGQILAEPDVTAVDLFDAFSGTPTLALLQQYDIVYAFSNNVWFDAVAMGDVLADYEDGGGVVVVSTFAWDSRGGWLLQGRWVTGGYSPYNSTSTTLFSTNTATITDPSHPLMQGVSSLTAFYRNGVTLTSGAASVAVWTDGPPAVAYKENNGHTAVGLNAYLGIVAEPFTGEWGRTIVNAGRWLSNCGPTPTPTPTPAQIVLTYQARRGAGRETVLVRLMWTGANSPRVDIYRNGEPLARVDNTGSYTDELTEHAFFTYKVCEGHSRNCSNEVTVRGP
jgi:hypothetical protein